jgi:hypothetical protein
MRSRLMIAAAVVLLAALPVVAHHMADGMVDEEIYDMIDDIVSGTPHGDFDINEIGDGMMQIDIMSRVQELDELVAADMFDYVNMLDGEVVMTIAFIDGMRLEITILQIEDPDEGFAKAFTDQETETLSGVKDLYR